jgi:uncharacterized protein (DUF433 family)
MALEEITPQLLALSTVEKAQALQLLLQSLSGQWTGIEKTAGICGGDARIANTRIPVWVLVQARDWGHSDAALLQDYPTLTAIDLANAWTYSAAHLEEIQHAIQENNNC